MNTEDFAENFPGRLVPTPHDCVAFVPDLLPPNIGLDSEIRQANECALLALGELRAIIPALPNPKLITQPFLRREAVLSSKIEGTHTEIEGLYLYEATARERKTGRGTDTDGDAQEVHNYVVALEHGLGRLAELPVCNRLVKEMHEKLLDGVTRDRGLYKMPGKFRNRQAFIGSSDIHAARFVAPPWEMIDGLMADLERYINSDSGQPTLIDLALIHYQFETIHPFADGNGRIGRLLIAVLLAARSILPEPLLYLSAYFERHREKYVKRLWEVSRAGAWCEWIGFFLQGVHDEAVDAVNRARQILALREDYRAQVQSDKGSASSLIELIDCLFRWPALNVTRAADQLHMTYPGALKNVKKLEERGIIEEVTGYSRNKLYLAKPIIRLMS